MNVQTDQIAPSIEIDEIKLQGYLQEIRGNQNLASGIIGGIAAAFIGAAIWALITIVTNYQIGWMAVGVGVLVGFAVRHFGKGIDTSFGIAGAVLSLFGCVMGNMLVICIAVAQEEGVAILDVLSQLNPEITFNLLKVTFNPIDLVFYGIAVYEGYKFSFRKATEEELSKITK